MVRPCRRALTLPATCDGRAWLVINSTKTIQFNERELRLPLALLPASHSDLCPSIWLRRLFALVPHAPDDPLFSLPPKRGRIKTTVLTYKRFMAELRRLLHLQGINAADYGGQSFRRGGATFAFEAKVAPGYIKLQGDWHSACYELYAGVNPTAQLAAVDLMAAAISALALATSM